MGAHYLSPNKLLASLPQDEYDHVARALRRVSVKSRDALARHGDRIREVYFPAGGAFSLERTFDDGRVAEVALVGAEGFIGGEIFYGTTEFPTDCRPVTRDVPVYAMSADSFRRHVARRGAFHNLIVRYQQSLMSQIAQTLACSGLHSAKQRTCRWMLMVHDRATHDVIPISDVRLGEMLGVRTQSIARTVRGFAGTGAIETRRGGFAIVNRAEIAAGACECYHTMRVSFERLLPEISARHDSIIPRARA
jgi:CRP-like cAMP-binding protein